MNKDWRDAWVDSIENHESDWQACDDCDAYDDDDCEIKKKYNLCPLLPDEAA